jgi:hypothetical protein
MRRGCQVVSFGQPKGPVRDNLDDAQSDAVRLALGAYDEGGRLYLDAGVELKWVPIAASWPAVDAPAQEQPKRRAR